MPDAPLRLETLQNPALLRRLLRAKDRIDAASHEAWPVERLARVSGVSQAHFARSFKHLSAAQRPDLTMAVSEKRRREAVGTNPATNKEV